MTTESSHLENPIRSTGAHGAVALQPRAEALDFFTTLVEWWRRDTGGLSSPSEKAAHPAYQLIIQMGEKVVPFILTDLRDHGGDWYIALRKITNARPVPAGAARSTADVVAAWLQWGRDNHYIL